MRTDAEQSRRLSMRTCVHSATRTLYNYPPPIAIRRIRSRYPSLSIAASLRMTRQPHKYEYEPQPNSAPPRVVRLVGDDKRVLELGPGPGAITNLLKDNRCRVTALELDPDAIEIVAQYCEHVYSCDLNDPSWPQTLAGADKFDVIVAADVLEHLYDPWNTLRNLPPLLADDGYVVISLPHVGHNAVTACLIAGDLEYQPWGLLDKTHIRFFGIKNIQKLFNDAGFKIVEVEFVVKTPEQTEIAPHWLRLPAETRQVLGYSKFGTVYQVVVKAVPESAPGKGLDIASVPIPPPSAGPFSRGARGRFWAFILSLLSLKNRNRLDRIFERIGFRS